MPYKVVIIFLVCERILLVKGLNSAFIWRGVFIDTSENENSLLFRAARGAGFGVGGEGGWWGGG